MSKNKLFGEESDDEVVFKTENEYAKKYDSWRGKEEIHKLEQKYGTKALSSDVSASSSEDESDEPPEISEEMEEQFLKTLALLKTKDPRIYDTKYTFFDENKKEEEKKPKAKTLTFDDSDDDDEDDGMIFKVEKKAEIASEAPEVKEEVSSPKKSKTGKIKDYLTGKAAHVDEEVEQDLAPLKALWSDPKLDENEAFLRDYILNKRYLEVGAADDSKLRDDEALEEDEKRVEEQGQFERAYNFRFEEPDHEYLKRFPRTLNSIRPADGRRAKHRAELRERKEREKAAKMEEIARLKALKLKEIQEKIARIKEVTGNQELAFEEEDVEGDFDPDAHDRRMRELFDEQYYGADADQHKPVFPDLDDELEIENWDKYEPEREREDAAGGEGAPHCEDQDFNMDADYDPKQARANLLQQIQLNLDNTKKRRNRKKKSKLAQLLASEKPKFVPTAGGDYSHYMEEYYQMDCEDIIGGDLPTRFKYREVVPNDFGLSVEEILLADDKELTQWVPLKKIVKHRPADVEKGEVKTYRQKAADLALKRKVLPSLFKDLPEEPELVVPIDETIKKKKKKKKKNKEKSTKEADETVEDTVDTITEVNGNNEENDGNTEIDDQDNVEVTSKRKKKKHKEELNTVNENNEGAAKKKKKKHKVNYESQEVVSQDDIHTNSNEKYAVKEIELGKVNKEGNTELSQEGNRKKKKNKTNGFVIENIQHEGPSQTNIQNHSESSKKEQNNTLKRKLVTTDNLVPKKKNKNIDGKFKNHSKLKFKQTDKFKNKQRNDTSSDNPLNSLSDERLKAYGLNPKKYRSFLKYKKF